MNKIVLYLITVPFIIWIVESINLNQIFKKNRVYQAQLFQLVLVMIISYLLVNFFYDLFFTTILI